MFGDVEFGAGTVTDDFISDSTFAKVIRSLKGPVDLILNGDTFDFLKCPLKDGTYPLQVTEAMSLEKLEQVLNAHPKVIRALAVFTKGKNHKLYFNFGNHDLDLAFPKVQNRLAKAIGKVHFGLKYEQFGVHVEHGQQFDPLNRTKEFFVEHYGKKLLNLSYSSLGVIESFMRVKEDNPFLERIHSRNEMFTLHPQILRTLRWQGIKQIFRQFFYDMTRNRLRKTPHWLWKELWRRWWQDDWEISNIVAAVKKQTSSRLCVLGHMHHVYFEESDRIVILPDTWRDEYILDARTKTLIPKNKYYVRIRIENNAPKYWELVHVPIKRSVLRFDDVVKDQMKYLLLAKKEEDTDKIQKAAP